MTQLIGKSFSWLAAVLLAGGLMFTACGNDNSMDGNDDATERPVEAENTAASNSTSHYQSSETNAIVPDSLRTDSLNQE